MSQEPQLLPPASHGRDGFGHGYRGDYPGPGQSKLMVYCVYSMRQLGWSDTLNRRKNSDGT
jgi:hypothetical protein